MKLGFLLGYSGKQVHIPIDLIKQAESMGYDSVWTAEAYGNDAVTSASWVLAQTEKIRVGTAIMQMPARTPAMAAMTAMSLHQLSGGRFIVGLGASGPQVVEGWHGVPYGKPVTRTKEYIQIMRKIMGREGPVTFDGKMDQWPASGEGTTGLGKPLKFPSTPPRSRLQGFAAPARWRTVSSLCGWTPSATTSSASTSRRVSPRQKATRAWRISISRPSSW